MRKLPVYSVETDKKMVCLTFDAAWGADKTQKIIDLISGNEIKATFFLTGFWIDKYEEEVKMLNAAGIETENHSENHPDMTKLSKERMRSELLSVNKKLKALTGKETRYFRPPFGSYNDKLIETAEEVGLTVVQWDVDSLDWKDNKTSTIVNRVLSKVRNGSIILFHNNSDFVWEAVGILIPTLKNMGYEFALISELVATQNYTIDHTGRQTINKNDIS
jgi:polysaccharide deacetylase family sporulation protein PdaB